MLFALFKESFAISPSRTWSSGYRRRIGRDHLVLAVLFSPAAFGWRHQREPSKFRPCRRGYRYPIGRARSEPAIKLGPSPLGYILDKKFRQRRGPSSVSRLRLTLLAGWSVCFWRHLASAENPRSGANHRARLE